ncbi:nuclear transport factor 2 family protein [Paraburkholderia sp. 2C]
MRTFFTRNESGAATAGPNLPELYLGSIACLNRYDWPGLYHFVADDVQYNDRMLRLPGYIRMQKMHCDEIPDLYFQIGTLMASPPLVASPQSADDDRSPTDVRRPVESRNVFVSRISSAETFDPRAFRRAAMAAKGIKDASCELKPCNVLVDISG